MPGWHEATRDLRESGKLRMVGLIQEQHPDRCRLFMQWKRMDWPVMVDSLDLLDVSVVPITLFVDEHGIVRRNGAPLRDARALAEAFVAETFAAPPESPAKAISPSQRDRGDRLFLWGGPSRREEAVAAYRSAPADDARARFREGVVHRSIYDEGGDADAFGRAIAAWSEALELDPNNYIWRRRIQQFGPRQTKPYPFYDWVDRAADEIRARGERPAQLTVRPRGAELAQPAREFAADLSDDPPRARRRILRDPGELVRVHATTVPPAPAPGEAARVHLELRPRTEKNAHWNNEAGGLVVWIEPAPGQQVDRRRHEVAPADSRASDEPRRVEVEVRLSAEGGRTLSGYSLYYVCEGIDGACLYRRQDLRVDLAPTGGP